MILIMAMSLSFICQAQVHIHGQGELLIAQEDNHWQVQLTLPAADALGFEHTASTPEQQQVKQSLAKRLAKNIDIIEFKKTCKLQSSKHSLQDIPKDHHHSDQQKEQHKHHHGHKHGAHTGEHTDVEVEYMFTCPSPVSQIAVKLFPSMPSLTKIDARWITENAQGAAQLSPNDWTIKF
jgi:G3E family GTPase